jgi:hypothetical protein
MKNAVWRGERRLKVQLKVKWTKVSNGTVTSPLRDPNSDSFL